MFCKLRSPEKILLLMVMSILLWAGSSRAMKWEECIEESRSFIVHQLPKTKEDREAVIKEIFSQPDVSSFDLSQTDINDGEMPLIAFGLAIRKTKFSLTLLDLSTNSISRQGIKSLLIDFQNGFTINDEKFYPDVRQTILKVSAKIDITNELLSKWQRLAPSVFAGGLTLVESL